MKILIVDDSKEILHILNKSLSSQHEVHLAAWPDTALEMIIEVDPNLVITDYSMPTFTGVEFIGMVKDKYARAGKTLPIIWGMSSLWSYCDMLKETGATRVFDKGSDSFIEGIQDALEGL